MTWAGMIQNHEWTRMDTNGHEWAKGEEEKGDFNHEIHEKARNDVSRDDSEPRMHTNGHEGGIEGDGI